MVLDPLKLGFAILLFLPGFIFVEVREHHLSRQRKPQFEKTLEIVLWSAFIWLVALAAPGWWPFEDGRTQIYQAMSSTLAEDVSAGWARTLPIASAWFFLSVNGWAFLVANLWGIVRKSFYVDAVVKFVTGRDWYPSVLFRFFREALDKAVVVRLDDRRYLGILFSAPDANNDNYIILKKVSLLPEVKRGSEARPATDATIEQLPLVESLLLRVDEVREIQLLEEHILRKIERRSAWDRAMAIFKSRKEKSNAK